ncbi:MAG: hypothetical protein ACT4OU_04745 [Hyphomicrobium sp.]
MRMITKTFALALAAGVCMASAVDTASAKRWNEYDGCYDAIEGIGRGTGVFGRGTQRARYAARRDWERNASYRYGAAYGNLGRAYDVQWDCKKNAVLVAKCVVIAKPCRARLRG